jgi:hypothetical protein
MGTNPNPLSVAFAILVCALALCGEACTESLTPVVAPDRQHTATVSTMNGGATEPWHTTVSLYSIRDRKRHVVFSSEDDPRSVHLTWVSNTLLHIRTPGHDYQPKDPEYSCSDAPDVKVSCEIDWSWPRKNE